MAQGHVFISYSRKDADFVNKLANRLRALRMETWRDIDALPAGQEWQHGIDDALREADALVVVLSPDAVKSQNVAYEWAFALGAGIRVIPVLKKAATIHPRLAALQFVDFTKPGKPWLRLVDALQMPRPTKRLSAGARIRAEFELEDGEPLENDGTYVILLSIVGAPATATRAAYEVHDETFDPSKWSEKNADSGFDTWMKSYGDVLLSADIESPSGKLHLETTLFKALRRTHGRSTNRAIQKALRDIERN